METNLVRERHASLPTKSSSVVLFVPHFPSLGYTVPCYTIAIYMLHSFCSVATLRFQPVLYALCSLLLPAIFREDDKARMGR
jgi:hypothetical protein